MNSKPGGLYYSDYLQLEKLLDSQHPASDSGKGAVHDEMLFIIVHQAYELWFKQILHEIRSIIAMFGDNVVDERQMGLITARLERVHRIQHVLIGQLEVIETMTPLDFLDFRDLLIPASGFQSVQFKELEVLLGLKREMRIPADREFIYSRLSDDDRQRVEKAEAETSLLDRTCQWLERTPFLRFDDFEFWPEYSQAVERMLARDIAVIRSSSNMPEIVRQHQLAEQELTRSRFRDLLEESRYEKLREEGHFRFSHRAMLAALFVNLYRDEPILQLPFRFLTALLEMDQNFTSWRARHALMVHRMLGTRIGTGGSSGHEYLARTTRQNRVFVDLFNLSSFLIPRSDLPKLPASIVDAMRFRLA